MAEGARDRLGRHLRRWPPPGSPGPDPAEGKPAGTVYIAASAGHQPGHAGALALAGSRDAIRAGHRPRSAGLLLVSVREETPMITVLR